jgi:hypothetical protein
MSFGKMFAGFGPAAGQAGMQAARMAVPPPPPTSLAKIPLEIPSGADMLSKLNETSPFRKKGLFDRVWGKMDKDKMRETGIGLINQAMQQQQGPQGPTLAPFQPGGGGGMPAGGGTPQLVALAQQLGLNRVL